MDFPKEEIKRFADTALELIDLRSKVLEGKYANLSPVDIEKVLEGVLICLFKVSYQDFKNVMLLVPEDVYFLCHEYGTYTISDTSIEVEGKRGFFIEGTGVFLDYKFGDKLLALGLPQGKAILTNIPFPGSIDGREMGLFYGWRGTYE